MIQAFILFCIVGSEHSPQTCFVDLSTSFFTTEKECQESMVKYLSTEVLPKMHSDWEIVNLGCTQYLKEDKKGAV